MKPINTGTADFADLIKNNAIYVDKTAYIHRLVSDTNNRVVFMSRRRDIPGICQRPPCRDRVRIR